MHALKIRKLAHLLIWACALAWIAPSYANQCPAIQQTLTAKDKEIARHAWRYFENNTQGITGLVNAVNNYPSTTMWDTGSAIAGIIAARQLGFIDQKDFDSRIDTILTTLLHLDLFNWELPNKVYQTQTADKVDYTNRASEHGIGISALDLGRLSSWLNILSCLHPHHKDKATAILESWVYCRMINKGQMFGASWDKEKGRPRSLQEGRLGYEQYAAKMFQQLGFDQYISAKYLNQNATHFDIYGIPIAVDKRDSRTLGAYNYVVAESYAMDAMEHGIDEELETLLNNIYKVQKRRYEKTGIVTAVSEDNIDRRPYFIYNTIFTDGEPWKAITDTGQDMHPLKTVSVKAAFSMAYLFPDDPYSQVLIDHIWEARNPKGGWYSGVFEDESLGFNKATSGNTNGVILSIFLYKMLGPLNQVCSQCGKGVSLSRETLNVARNKDQCWADFPTKIQAAEERTAKMAGILKIQKTKLAAKKRQDNINKVWAIYGNVKYAEKLKNQGKTKEAATKIKALKKKIWKLGDLHKSEQKNLRSLMHPIDVVAGKWNAGKRDASAEKIQETLKKIALRLQEK